MISVKNILNEFKKIILGLFKTKKGKLIFSLLLILFIILPTYFIFFSKKSAEASWWNESWFYRKSIPVTNSSGTTLNDFQVKILDNYDLSSDVAAGKIQSDLDDLRFTTLNGIILNYWIEDSTASSVDIWAKLPSVPTTGATVYMYYGNAQAEAYANGNEVFEFFDDFNFFDTSRWAATGAYSVNDGKITITTGAVYSKSTIKDSPQNLTTEMKAKYSGADSSYSGICISNSQATTGSNSTSKTLTYNMTQASGYSLAAWGADGSVANYNITSGTNIYNQTINTDYIVGYTFQGSSNIKYFVKNLAYADLGSTTPAGTWNHPFYLWLGFFTGSTAGTNDIDDTEVDWVRIRKYASAEPVVGTIGSEEKSPAPVLYLSFDEGYGTTVYDESSNKNNGTIFPTAVSWANGNACISGNCVLVNDVGSTFQSIQVADNSKLGGMSGITVGAWVKTTENKASQQIIYKRQSNGVPSWSAFRLDLANLKPTFYVSNAAGTTASAQADNPIELNKWYYIVGIYDGSQIKVFVDNVSADATPGILTGNVLDSDAALLIGGLDTPDQFFFHGFLDEVKIYPYARSADQIKQDYNAGLSGIKASQGTSVSIGSSSDKSLNDGLVGHWKMDENSGNSSDSSGNSNIATVSGTANYGAGKFGNGFRSGVATTNLILNPSAENDLNNWNYGAGNTITRVNTYSYFGNYSAEVTRPLSGGTIYNTWNSVTYVAGQQYVLSMFVRKADGSEITSSDITNMFIENVMVGINSINSVGNGWYRIVSNARTAIGSTSNVGFYMAENLTIYIDGVQLENSSSVTPYLDGSFSIGYAWSGTAHASTSSRSAGVATTANNINNSTGAIAFWFKSPSLDASAQCPFGPTDGDTNGGIFFSLKSNGILLTHKYAPGVTVTPQYLNSLGNNIWHHVAYVWDDSSRKGLLYVNGILQQEVSYTQAIVIGAYLQNIGKCTATGYTQFNGVLDDMRAYNRALSADEVKKLYEYAPGPIAYWNLDEKTGTVINDSSGNNYVGSLGTGSGMPNWAMGKLGNSLNFSSGKYAKVALGATRNKFATNVNGRSFSYSLWFKTDSVSTTQSLLTNNEPCNNPGNFSISLSGGNIRFNYYGSPDGGALHSVVPSPALQNNQWYHLEWTKTFGQLGAKAYLNGIPQAVTGDSVNLGRGDLNNVLLGAWNGDGVTCTNGVDEATPIVANSLRGSLDEVKIYNYVRTQEQILEDMGGDNPATKSPLGHWKFDEGQGVVANNSGINGSTLNGTISGSLWANDGKNGRALSFNGVSDKVSVSPIYLKDSDYTIAAWIKRNLIGQTHGIVTDMQYGWWNFYVNSSNKLVMVHKKTDAEINTVIGAKDIGTSWTHVLATFSQTEGMKIYVDGELDNSNLDLRASSLSQGRGPQFIGQSRHAAAGDTNVMNGFIDEVKIYNYALDDSEIKTLYNQNTPIAMGGAGASADNNGTPVTGEAAKYCIPGDSAKCDAPKLELKMDEKTGTIAYDTSGNGNNGTLINTPSSEVVGKNGGALNFNGSGKRATLATPIGQTEYTTTSLWYKRSEKYSSTSWRTLLGHVSANIHHLIINSSSRNLGIWDGGWKDFGYNPLDDGKWHHYEIIYNSGINATLYVDGVYKNQIATTLNLATNPIGSIGNWGSGTYWAGLIDDVKIYDYARTPAQIAWDYNRGKPIAHWRFDEGEGMIAHDEAASGPEGNGNDGTLTSMDAATDWVDGKNNKALDFDNINDSVVVSNSAILNYPKMVSISTWIKSNDVTANQTIISRNGPYFLRISGSRFRVGVYTGTWLFQNGTIPLENNTWHHLTLVYDGATVKSYVNGNLDVNAAKTGDLISFGNMYFGFTPVAGENYPFNGQIDDVKIYNYALTPLQVKQDYNNSSAVNFK